MEDLPDNKDNLIRVIQGNSQDAVAVVLAPWVLGNRTRRLLRYSKLLLDTHSSSNISSSNSSSNNNNSRDLLHQAKAMDHPKGTIILTLRLKPLSSTTPPLADPGRDSPLATRLRICVEESFIRRHRAAQHRRVNSPSSLHSRSSKQHLWLPLEHPQHPHPVPGNHW